MIARRGALLALFALLAVASPAQVDEGAAEVAPPVPAATPADGGEAQPPSATQPEPASATPSGPPSEAEPLLEEPLPERFRVWLEEVEPLILTAERRVFLSLRSDYQRDAFIDRFWRERDPYQKTARNELKVRYLERVAQARVRYGRLDDDRARIYLVHGEPAAMVEIRCSARYAPAEIWAYQGSDQVAFPIVLVFLVPRDGGPAAIWYPEMSGGDIQIDAAARCVNGQQLRAAVTGIRADRLDWELGFQRMLAKPRPRTLEWVDTFQILTTDLPAGAETFAAELEFAYPARYQQRTVTQGLIRVPVEAVTAGDTLGFRSYDFELTGEVVIEKRLFESFRYKFSFLEGDLSGGAIPLAFQRYLRPGSFKVVVKLEDLHGGGFFRAERELEVPRVETPYERPAEEDTETARLLAEATAALDRGETSIRIVPPRARLLRGFVRFDTLAVGEEIRKVDFLLDGRRLLTKTRPPYNVEIDLGEFPRPHTLRVEALDAEGGLLAYDQLDINTGGQAFAVRLLEPRRGVAYRESLLARARVEVPEGRSLHRLEIYLNERLLATLYQPPFAQPIVLPPGEELTYVRAVAYLPDGSSAEDLVFVNAPGHLEEIDVQVVELYTNVFDRFGRPVLDLGRDDFKVFEDDVEQQVKKFETVSDRAVQTVVLFDNSASMAPILDAARIAALTFFRDAVGVRDRAAVITFNRVPRLAVGLTNDLRLLGGGLAGLTAEGETALYDSILFGLYYLGGVRGQRALIVLSDGKDEVSRFGWKETLDYARRAGVAVYPIGLGLADPGARSRLGELASETGGRAFFLNELNELTAAYARIQEELRAQYLLTYQSTNSADDEAFRTIRVELADKSLAARTLSGYYP